MKMKRRRYFCLSVLLGCSLCLHACARKDLHPDRCQLSGQVTIDGAPLADADVQLLFGPNNLLTSTGFTDAKGNYELRNVKPGKYKVVIRYPGMASLQKQVAPAKEKTATQTGGPPVRLSPLYSDPRKTQLTVELEAGMQTTNFSLKTNPATAS